MTREDCIINDAYTLHSDVSDLLNRLDNFQAIHRLNKQQLKDWEDARTSLCDCRDFINFIAVGKEA